MKNIETIKDVDFEIKWEGQPTGLWGRFLSLIHMNFTHYQITKDEFLQKYFDEKYFLTNKIKELEKNLDVIQKEKTQYEVDYKVLTTKYDEIIKRYEKSNLELINTKQIHDNELYNIDNKINDLSKEVEKLQNENYELRREIETQRNSMNTLAKEKDMMKERYEEAKYENDLLNSCVSFPETGNGTR